MKNIAAGGILERIRRLAPPHVTAPFKTVAEWREWQLSEGQKRCEEINRQNRQLRVEKILNRSGIQPLHRKCSFANYQVQNDGQRYSLNQAKSIADELMTGCTNFAFSGKPGTGKNHLAAAIGNRLLKDGQTVIVVTVADVMSALHASYDDGQSGEKFCGNCAKWICWFLMKLAFSARQKTSRWCCTRLLIAGQRRCAAWGC